MTEMPEERGESASSSYDLYVDIDGTLLRTDLLHEAAWRHVKTAPWRIFTLLRLALKGPAPLKTFLARKIQFDPATLPYESAVTDLIARRKTQGGRTVLISASHQTYASRIAEHLDLPGGGYGSSNRLNLKGAAKLSRIQALNQGREFVYAGNSAADRPIWAASKKEILVNAPSKDVRAATQSGRAEMVIQSRPPVWRAFLKEMRLHQWAKNTLVFVPLFTSHSYRDLHLLGLAFLAFLAFGLCASGHYFLNDLLDLDADRAHRTKRRRPLASGDLPILYGPLGAILLPIAGLALAIAFLPWKFTLLVAGYLALTNLYSFVLKSRSTADVFALALLYTVRVIAGGAALAISLSSWLLAFSMFVFISLAYLKRYIEIVALAEGQAKGRGYVKEDAETIFSLGIANATAATVVLAFYVNSAEVKTLYHEPELLWLLCLLMLYWSNRIWIGAKRGKINDDPVIFAIKDRISQYIFAAMVAVVLAARILPKGIL
ncbi:MAG TPA: UbiA family prenyltransferase [Rhizomicrobium sp.]|nr:UbiA family prenyltransferase [Rhizomicrobium sp.]